MAVIKHIISIVIMIAMGPWRGARCSHLCCRWQAPRHLQPSIPSPPAPHPPPFHWQELLANLTESRGLVNTLLDTLPSMFGHNRTAENALGPALDAAFSICQHIGGKMLVFQTALPSAGTGKLKQREILGKAGPTASPSAVGGGGGSTAVSGSVSGSAAAAAAEREHLLLGPDAGDDGAFYRVKAVDFSRQQISVDMFFFVSGGHPSS